MCLGREEQEAILLNTSVVLVFRAINDTKESLGVSSEIHLPSGLV